MDNEQKSNKGRVTSEEWLVKGGWGRVWPGKNNGKEHAMITEMGKPRRIDHHKSTWIDHRSML